MDFAKFFAIAVLFFLFTSFIATIIAIILLKEKNDPVIVDRFFIESRPSYLTRNRRTLVMTLLACIIFACITLYSWIALISQKTFC